MEVKTSGLKHIQSDDLKCCWGGLFVEELTCSGWNKTIKPFLFHGSPPPIQRISQIYYIDGDEEAIQIAKEDISEFDVSIERLDFIADQVIDEKGTRMWMRMFYRDMSEVLGIITESSTFQQFLQPHASSNYLTTYLSKQCLPGSHVLEKGSIWRAIYIVQVCFCRARELGRKEPFILFLNRRVWFDSIIQYARNYGQIQIHPVGDGPIKLIPVLYALLFREYVFFAGIINRVRSKDYSSLFKGWNKPKKIPSRIPKVSVEYYGHLNLDCPDLYSDFFFWQQSSLSAENLIALFRIGQNRFDKEMRDDLSQYAIEYVLFNGHDVDLPNHRVYSGVNWYHSITSGVKALLYYLFSVNASNENRWLKLEHITFGRTREFWEQFFIQHNIKVYTTWFKYNSDHCIMAEALKNTGGIFTVYQRSYEGLPSAQTTISADIVFVHSHNNAGLEGLSQSRINYCVTVGYVGDHRFKLVEPAALKIRSQLQENGARLIVALFDENSGNDSRWFVGHEGPQEEYAFWLEKLLEDDELGLVIKPKSPKTLRRRLGDVANLLDRALQTGRCFISEAGVIQGSAPPALAAKAADVAVHGSLYSLTAAVEAALAGTPVLVKDDGLPGSPMYTLLGEGKVIFNDWNSLWSACMELKRHPDSNELGDWSHVLDDLDPFRDGKAAERMGTYLNWLVQDLTKGIGREAALVKAAERYSLAWGADKISEVVPITSTAHLI
jgi:hypothetical protein